MKEIPNIIYSTFAVLTLACLALSPIAKAAGPAAPDTALVNGNTADGDGALAGLTDGFYNSAFGFLSLLSNGAASFNTGVGAGVLLGNTAIENTGVGAAALLSNTTGANNTAVGAFALSNNSTGDYITALGSGAGTDTGIVRNNIYIGDPGFAGDENVISIGGIAASGTSYGNTYIGGIYGTLVSAGTALPVYVDTDGHLGTSLVDARGSKVRIRGPQGAHPQAKLNEFQKQQEKRIAELESTVARLAATVKEQAAQIQKVSAQLEASKLTPHVVANAQ